MVIATGTGATFFVFVSTGAIDSDLECLRAASASNPSRDKSIVFKAGAQYSTDDRPAFEKKYA